MELSQPRPYAAAEGRKPTRDFLSLYNSHSTAQQDPRPPSQGNYIKTHDFLQPLEQRVGEGFAKEENASEEISAAEKTTTALTVQHVLPGGIGTYSITHNSHYFKAPKAEGTIMFTAPQTSSTDINGENSISNCTSHSGSGFTLWEDSAANKGNTGKETIRNNPAVIGPWGSSSEWPSQLSSNNHLGNYSSLSSSLPSGHRSQSFMELIKSVKRCTNHEDELQEENHIALKKETPSSATLTPKELKIKIDGKSSDQANTPRSKHSATEQRRRSKINDRFKMLRELIPHGDQKRDKASFLLEVIEYIQFLQEKVQKYEGPYQGWNNEHTKLMPWRNTNRTGESFDHSVFPMEFDEKPLPVSQAVPGSAQNSVVQSDTTLTTKGLTFPTSLQPNCFAPVRDGGAVPQVSLRLPSDLETTSSRPQYQFCQTRSCTTVDGDFSCDKLKEEDLTIESGTISISSAYSEGLLTVLTQALQSSGIDLSQASVSVQIELGKRAKSKTTSVTKDNEISPSNQVSKLSTMAPIDNVSDQPQKKFKTIKN